MLADDSILQKRVTLAELIELDSFRDVMKSFCDLYRVGVKVFDEEGTKLVDIRVGNGPFCGYLFEHGASRQACTQLVSGLKNDALETRGGQPIPRLVDCFSGLRYVVIPLVYEGDLMGRLIFGPFLPPNAQGPAEQLYQLEPRLDREKAATLIRSVRQAPDELVAKVLQQLQKVMEVILFTSYRALLTSQMHIESVTASYQELQEKNRVLSEANERLQELDKMKSNFLATISHELRTPLTSVIGYSEMLLEGMAGDLNEEQHEYVKTIMTRGESLLGMISQILDLSRIESGHLRLNFADFRVSETLQSTVSSVLPQAQKKSLHLDVDVPSDLGMYRGDREKISQVVVNLLGNAVKFTPAEGRVALRVDRWTGPRRNGKTDDNDHGAGDLFDLDDETFLRIIVEDSGIGIPAEKVGRVFDRFYQVDNSSTREYGGTGLGLSIVKSFVDGHGGEIWCESDTGKGARFTVLLPVQ